jgi:subfamily B ATP-binding cassette protein HlyB/CyaB
MQDWDELNKIGVSMEKVDEIITSRTENINLEEVKSSTSLRGDIHFENVFFQYGNEHSPMVLKKINLSIPQGRVVAFVGSSGSGKTTLAYMLNRLYSPTKGKILIGDLDTEELPLYELRSNIAMISQENTLFAGTFLSNITLGDSNPDLG